MSRNHGKISPGPRVSLSDIRGGAMGPKSQKIVQPDNVTNNQILRKMDTIVAKLNIMEQSLGRLHERLSIMDQYQDMKALQIIPTAPSSSTHPLYPLLPNPNVASASVLLKRLDQHRL